jgi:hypothetical protein
MKFRSTLLLLVLAVGIFAYIKFVETKQPTTRDTMRDGKKVVSLDRDKINAISIKSAGTEIELRKGDNNVWMLEKPVKDRADSMAINGLFTSAEYLKYDAVLGEDKPVEKDQLKEFGLSNSETKVAFSGEGKPVELLFGKDAAVEGKLYVKLADDKKVFVIPNELKNQLTKKPDEFRDRKLSDLTTAQVNKVAIKTAAGEIELEKKNDHWSLTKPLKARGDDAKIGDVISQATTARIDSFVADSANLATYGLQEPRGTVSLFSEGNDQPTVLQIGANPKDEKDKTYAKLSSREPVVVLPKSIESLLETKPNDLRDKNLVRVEADIVDRINIEGAGAEKIVLARKGESWVRKTDKDLPINAANATRLLNDLKAQLVTKFEADVATDLPKYGLDQPTVKVTLSSYASENTAETKAGEKPIVTVLFGKVEGDNVYAKLDEEPFIVSVPKTILESIPTDPVQWQDVTIYKFKPEEITAIEVTKRDQPTVAIERDKEKWRLAKGDGNLNQITAQSLVNTLSSLRAVRWIGAAKPEHGLDKPAVTVTFKTSTNASGKLTIGAVSPDEMWFANTDGLTGIFAISRPDEEAFVSSLIDKPAAAPPAAPASSATTPPAAAPPTPVPATPPATEAPAAPTAPNP